MEVRAYELKIWNELPQKKKIRSSILKSDPDHPGKLFFVGLMKAP